MVCEFRCEPPAPRLFARSEEPCVSDVRPHSTAQGPVGGHARSSETPVVNREPIRWLPGSRQAEVGMIHPGGQGIVESGDGPRRTRNKAAVDNVSPEKGWQVPASGCFAHVARRHRVDEPPVGSWKRGPKLTAKTEWIVVGLLAVGTATVFTYAKVTKAKREELLEREANPPPAPIPAADALSVSESSDGLPREGMWRGTSRLADLNGDDKLDLVSSLRRWDHSRSGEGLFVWLGTPDGTWEESTEGLRRDMGYGGVDVGDVNNDGFPDVAFSGHDVTPHVFLGDGKGKWSLPETPVPVEFMCADVALGDANQDGNLDIAALGFAFARGDDMAGLVVLHGDGKGGFEDPLQLLPSQHFGAFVDFVDMDGDGDEELIAATEIGPRVWAFEGGEKIDLSTGLTTMAEVKEGQPELPYVGGSDRGVLSIDINDDGIMELLVCGMWYPGHDPLQLFQREGEEWSRIDEGFPADEAFFDIRLAELDGQAPKELVAAGKHGISVFRSLGSGRFERMGRLEGARYVYNVCTGDVDGDGIDEIVSIEDGGIQVLHLTEESRS